MELIAIGAFICVALIAEVGAHAYRNRPLTPVYRDPPHTGITEPSPWINEQLKSHLKGYVRQEFVRVYPRTYHPDSPPVPPPSPSPCPLTETQQQPAVAVVATSEPQPVQPAEQPAAVEHFETEIQPFIPLTLDPDSKVTRQAVWQALDLGYSQNKIVSELFQLAKGTAKYNQAVAIIKDVQKDA